MSGMNEYTWWLNTEEQLELTGINFRDILSTF